MDPERFGDLAGGRRRRRKRRPYDRETDRKIQEDTATSILSLGLISAPSPEHWMEGWRDG